MIIDEPVRFDGTPEQAAANLNTHAFAFDGGDEEYLDMRCMWCDCKPWHAAASYPCGIEPPRRRRVVAS